MKRRLRWLALLCALLLAGCGYSDTVLPTETPAAVVQEERAEPRDFSAMEYVRPDIEGFEQHVEKTLSAVQDGEDLALMQELLAEYWAQLDNYDTMYVLANIRYCQDTSDGYYADEYAWCSDGYSIITQLSEKLDSVCANSPYAEQLEQQTHVWNDSTDPMGDESVELMRRESALLAEYRELVAAPEIELDGQSFILSDYLAEADWQDYDRAMEAYYLRYNPLLADIYIRLMQVRAELAASLGYDSYEQMQYEYYFSRDYSPEQADAYIEDIKTYIRPLYLRAGEDAYDDELSYDYYSESELLNIMQTVAGGMGGYIAEAFDFMTSYGLYDVAMRDNKASASFQAYIRDYDAPFLFIEGREDSDDIIGFAHEFGHYTEAYVNLGSFESADLAECYSQAMEYLALWRLDGVLPEKEAENLRLMKLLDTLYLYITQGALAEFERRVYAMDTAELSAESLNAVWEELAESWGYMDEANRTGSVMGWIDVPHLFEQPFYVISYPVSNDVALQIFALEQESPGAGLNKYNELLPRDSGAMIETAEGAGLSSPFAEGRVQKAAALLEKLIG